MPDGAQAALGLDLGDCALAVIRGARSKYVHFTGLPPLLAWRSRHLDRTLTGISLTPGGPYDARA